MCGCSLKLGIDVSLRTRTQRYCDVIKVLIKRKIRHQRHNLDNQKRTHLYESHLRLGSVIYQLNYLGVICPKGRVEKYSDSIAFYQI